MKRRISFCLCTFLVTCLLGMGGKPQGVEETTRISQVNIADNEVLSRNRPLIVSFSAPMVDTAKVGTPVRPEEAPFTLTPPVAGTGKWITEDSFAFAADKGYPKGKRVFVQFRENLKDRGGEAVRYLFSFRTAGMRVTHIYPRVAENDRTLPLELTFNQPLPAATLRERLSVKDAGTDEALPFTVEGDSEASSQLVQVTLGERRDKIALAIRKDDPKDAEPAGFTDSWDVTLSLHFQDGAPAEMTTAAKRLPDQETESPLNISSSSSGENSDNARYARFSLSEPVADQDLKPFIDVLPNLPYQLSENRRTLVFSEGVEPGMAITVTLKPGLADAAGRILKTLRSDSLTVRDRAPRIDFAEPGNLLTPTYGSRIAVKASNISEAMVSLRRIYDNNLPFMSYQDYSDAGRLSRNIAYKTVQIHGKKNELLRRAIDVEALADGQRGVFILEVNGYTTQKRDDGSSYRSWEGSESRVVVLSDIGITSRTFPSGVTVFASGLSTGKPLPGADVSVYSRSNQLIAQGKTGPDGVFRHSRDTLWDGQLEPNVVTVSTGDDLSFLPMDGSTTMELADNGERPYLDKGYEAFVYTPRGVFRPGETVNIKAFVRDGRHMPPAPFPVQCTVTSSRGLRVGEFSATLSEQGGADFSVALAQSAPTGEYTATLHIPGQQQTVLGSVRFSVEDFVPPRLEVAVTPSANLFKGKADIPVSLSAQYLFGAPGAALTYELGYKLSPGAFSPEGYDGYRFGDGERKFDPQTNLKFLTGALDNNGKTELSFEAPNDWLPPAMMQVLLIGGVQEDGGRWVTQTGAFNYFPTPYLLGFKVEDRENLGAGKAVTVNLAAVTPEGANADIGLVAVEIVRVEGYWNTVRRDGRYTYVWNERQIPVRKLTVETQAGKGTFSFTPPSFGRYLIKGNTGKDGVTASTRVGVWGGGEAGDAGAGRMDQVELAFDKPEYRAGETARLSVKAPYAGTLLLGIERGAQLSTRVVPMDKPATVLELPVTDAMDPNVTVTAWVFRPVGKAEKEWYAHRAYGSASLAFSRRQHTLTAEPVTPERALPGKPLTVPFTVRDENGNPVKGEFSVALVDEGILSLTAFKTPDPLAFFMARRRSVGQSYDAYDRLLRPEAKATAPLIPGGDGSEDYYGSLSTQQVFLTAYQPVAVTDDDGHGEVTFAVPEYSGKGRLMIVGGAGKAFASAAAPVRFARDIVVEASAPRAVAPGDAFDVTVKAFTLAPDLTGTAHISVSSGGPLDLSGETTLDLPLGGKDGKEAKSLTFRAVARKEHAVGSLVVDVRVPGRDDLAFSKRLEVVVRPPYPRTAAVRTALIRGGDEATLTLPGNWLKGSVKTALSVDKSPVLSVLPALEYLREYPYGCLEQTTSRAWPYLSLAAVEQTLHPESDATSSAANIKAQLAGIVARISSMQTSEGGFSMWPGGRTPDPWKSIHAAFFLVEAKAKTPVDRIVLTNALRYLKFLLAAPEGYFPSPRVADTTRAYAAFVLTRAGEPPVGWLQVLTERRNNMLPSGRIFLAAAKTLYAGNPKALEALDAEGGGVFTFDPAKLGYNETLESELRNLSLRLLAWTYVAPSRNETTELARIVAEKTAATDYFTTQTAGMVALALGSYLEKAQIGNAGYTAKISASSATVAVAESGKRLVLGTAALPVTTREGNPAPLSIAVEGKGQAYAVYSARGVSLDPPKPVSAELSVSRIWKNADGERIDLSRGPVHLKKGERITVELSITSAREISDVVVADLLPGGLEVENPRLKTAAGAGQGEDADPHPGASPEGDRGEDGFEEEGDGSAAFHSYGVNLDLREDRLLLFIGGLGKGETETYSYSMRAVSSGSFALPPLAAEGMYNPEAHALTAPGEIIVE